MIIASKSYKKTFYTAVFSFFVMMLSCCSSSSKHVCNVGIDPSFYPVNFSEKDFYVLGFSIDILETIAKNEHLPIQRVSVSWDNLIDGLNKHQHYAILSAMEPYVFNLEKYQFSENYLDIGPVLVMRKATKKLPSKEDELQIAMAAEDMEGLVLQHYPRALIKLFDTDYDGLVALESGQVDAAIMNRISANSYVSDLFNTLMIATSPLNNEGLKLITLQSKNEKFIKHFNHGLMELKKSGEYNALLKKWKLS